MALFDDLMAKMDEVKANAEETNGKVIAKLQELKDMIAALQDPNGANATQVQAALDKVTEIAGVVQGTEDTVDAA